MNKVILSGNLGKDAVIFNTSNADLLGIGCTLATNEKKGDKEETTWHDIVYFAKKEYADKLKEKMTKGSFIYVEGKVQAEMKKKDSVEYKHVSILASQIRVLASKDATQENDVPAPQGDFEEDFSVTI